MPGETTMTNASPEPYLEPVALRDTPLDRLLARLPEQVRASLTVDQRNALAAAMPVAQHMLDHRQSVRWLRRRFYVRLMIGNERRSLTRLERERQIGLAPTLALVASATWVLVSAAIVLAIAAVYLVKSAFGFDVLDGESLFHACFFQ